MTITISMQPDNNYRAGASLDNGALSATTQTQADANTAPPHVLFSEMLTVWRKLHVEVDSMSAPDFTNAQRGNIPAAPTFDPANNHAAVPLAGLDLEFRAANQHQVGRIDISTYGAFTTIATDVSDWPYTVEIVNAPANIVNAAGLWYNLWDDDAGSVPPFVMVGFNAPPVTLPRVLDTALMPQLFLEAYVDVAAPDMQYYDVSPFDFNVKSDEVEARGNESRDLSSSPEYWVVHVTCAFQGYTGKDGDPDTEEAVAGLQYGITVEQGQWPFPVHSSGALVYLETIRDKARGNSAQMTALERYTVVHEVGHQFLLQHSDGRWPPGDRQDPAGDYIMTDVLDQTGMAPNVAFGARCLKKIRESTYPPQP